MTLDIDSILLKTLELAESAGKNDEVPVGTVIFDDEGNIIAQSENSTRRKHSVAHHAELDCISKAGLIKGSENLSEYNLATSLEPCAMCAQAIAWSKIKSVYIVCDDEKSGGVLHNAKVFEHSHHKPDVQYIDKYKQKSAALLKSFFKSKRK